MNLFIGNVLFSVLGKGIKYLAVKVATPEKVAEILLTIMKAVAERSDNTLDNKVVHIIDKALHNETGEFRKVKLK